VVNRNFPRSRKLLRHDSGGAIALEPAMHDQMITLLEAVVGPLLLINSVGLARAASSIVRSLAANAIRVGQSGGTPSTIAARR
jgi:hypothetical protein